MTAALPITAAAELWDGCRPSKFDWQALLVFRSGRTRIYQFCVRTHDKHRAIQCAALEAKWDRAVAFKVRDTSGRVVHEGPVTDALGNPLDVRWRDALQGREAA